MALVGRPCLARSLARLARLARAPVFHSLAGSVAKDSQREAGYSMCFGIAVCPSSVSLFSLDPLVVVSPTLAVSLDLSETTQPRWLITQFNSLGVKPHVLCELAVSFS